MTLDEIRERIRAAELTLSETNAPNLVLPHVISALKGIVQKLDEMEKSK